MNVWTKNNSSTLTHASSFSNRAPSYGDHVVRALMDYYDLVLHKVTEKGGRLLDREARCEAVKVDMSKLDDFSILIEEMNAGDKRHARTSVKAIKEGHWDTITLRNGLVERLRPGAADLEDVRQLIRTIDEAWET